MGFFKSIFRFFSGATSLESKYKDDLVSPAKLKRDRIEVGSHLSVDRGYSAVIVCKQKVTDVFSAGGYKLKLSMLPYTDRRLNLKGRTKKRKNYKVKFGADLYYVNLSEFNDEPMRTNLKASIKDKEFKTVNFGIEGSFSFVIEDAEKFINTLLLILPRIKRGQALEYVNEWITVALMRLLERENKAIDQLFYNSQEVCDRMTEIIAKKMIGYGIKVSAIKIFDLDLPKRVRDVMDENSASGIIDFEKSDYILSENQNEQGVKDNYIDYNNAHLTENLRRNPRLESQQYDNSLSEEPVYSSSERERISYGDYGERGLQTRRSEQVVQEEFDRVFGNLINEAVNGNNDNQKAVFACKNCGAKVTAEEFYCPKCGRILD